VSEFASSRARAHSVGGAPSCITIRVLHPYFPLSWGQLSTRDLHFPAPWREGSAMSVTSSPKSCERKRTEPFLMKILRSGPRSASFLPFPSCSPRGATGGSNLDSELTMSNDAWWLGTPSLVYFSFLG
jgi:hypothetical protein